MLARAVHHPDDRSQPNIYGASVRAYTLNYSLKDRNSDFGPAFYFTISNAVNPETDSTTRFSEELVTVAEILGHTDIRITKRYSHGMQERKREALEKLVSFSPRQRDAKNVRKQKRQGARPAVST